LADEYKILDAASNISRRHILAQHLHQVIDVLEQKVSLLIKVWDIVNVIVKGNQIASLYDLLHFQDKHTSKLELS